MTIISMLGGCGSTQIVANMLRLGMTVHVRPEIAWLPARLGRPQRELESYWKTEFNDTGFELLDERGYNRLTSEWLTFRCRTLWQFSPDERLTILENLANYLRWCQDNDVSVVSEYMAELSVFSQTGIEGVVFVFRHPLLAYLAFAERHPDIIDRLGGISNPRAIATFGAQWASQISEYQKCRTLRRRPVKVLYESVGRTCPLKLRPLFDGWRPTLRHPHELPNQALQLLRRWTDDGLEQIYGTRSYRWRFSFFAGKIR